LKAEDLSIVRIEISHQVVNVVEPFALPNLKFGNGCAGFGAWDFDLKWQALLIGYAQQEQADSIRDGQAHGVEGGRRAFRYWGRCEDETRNQKVAFWARKKTFLSEHALVF